MKALLINKDREILEVTLTVPTLESIQSHLKCHTITGAGSLDDNNIAWADDNGLEDHPITVVNTDWMGPLALPILVTGTDWSTGRTLATTMSVDDLKTRVVFE